MTLYSRKRGLVSSFDSVNRVYWSNALLEMLKLDLVMHIVMMDVYCNGVPLCFINLNISITCLSMDTNMLISVILLEVICIVTCFVNINNKQFVININ